MLPVFCESKTTIIDPMWSISCGMCDNLKNNLSQLGAGQYKVVVGSEIFIYLFIHTLFKM